MKSNLFLILFVFPLYNIAQSCTITIEQKGCKKAKCDEPQVFFKEEYINPIKINDSTYNYTKNGILQPLQATVLIDKNKRPPLYVQAWFDSSHRNRNLSIDYSNSTIKWNERTEWDIFLQYVDSIQNKNMPVDDATDFEAKRAFAWHLGDSIRGTYIRAHPSSYLSLWFFTHGFTYTVGKSNAKKYFILLSPQLKYEYPTEYTAAEASILETRTPRIGEIFKDFTAEKTDGKFLNTESIKNKWILLDFWHSGCSPCIKGIGDFRNLYQSIDTSKIEFISINLDIEKSTWKKSSIFDKMLWPSVWVENSIYSDIARQYNVSAYPYFVLFNANKELDMITFGAEKFPLIKQKLQAINK